MERFYQKAHKKMETKDLFTTYPNELTRQLFQLSHYIVLLRIFNREDLAAFLKILKKHKVKLYYQATTGNLLLDDTEVAQALTLEAEETRNKLAQDDKVLEENMLQETKK